MDRKKHHGSARTSLRLLGSVISATLLVIFVPACSDDTNPVNDKPDPHPISVGLISQISTTMNMWDPTPASLMEKATRDFIGMMDGEMDEATIAWFHRYAMFRQIMTHDTSLLLSHLENGYPFSHGAVIWDALYGTIREVHSIAIRPSKAVILMTDGFEYGSKATLPECVGLALRDSVRIYVLSFGKHVDATDLITAANYGKGAYYHNPTRAQLREIYEGISDPW
ncbi:hypothetical protein KQI65_12365 [bacterium]|nr:hypothetical protein [bacterium]